LDVAQVSKPAVSRVSNPVTGSGSGTKIFAGGATWRSSMHEQEFITADGGVTFYPIARLNDRGDGCAAKGF